MSEGNSRADNNESCQDFIKYAARLLRAIRCFLDQEYQYQTLHIGYCIHYNELKSSVHYNSFEVLGFVS